MILNLDEVSRISSKFENLHHHTTLKMPLLHDIIEWI